MFQPGFSLRGRLINFAYKGVVFATIGMLAGLAGTSVSNGLLLLRKKLDPKFVTQNEPPSILGNASCWAFHMGLSSNLRYQTLNGIDMVRAGWGAAAPPPGAASWDRHSMPGAAVWRRRGRPAGVGRAVQRPAARRCSLHPCTQNPTKPTFPAPALCAVAAAAAAAASFLRRSSSRSSPAQSSGSSPRSSAASTTQRAASPSSWLPRHWACRRPRSRRRPSRPPPEYHSLPEGPARARAMHVLGPPLPPPPQPLSTILASCELLSPCCSELCSFECMTVGTAT